MTNPYLNRWEQRWHPLRQEWVIMAGHRQNRPWLGEMTDDAVAAAPAYDPTCYLCPGNSRVSGAQNPHYTSVYVFDNDHPCVGDAAPTELPPPTGIYRRSPASGVARVVCYSPRHNKTLAEMPLLAVEELVGAWQQQYRELGARPEVNHVLIFENKGEAVGVSNPHPHGQIYATNFVFKTIETEVQAGREHYNETGRILFQDILAAEQTDAARILFENQSAIAFIPYFGRYAYEVFVAPKQTHASVATLADAEVGDFAAALQHVLIKFDNLWQMPFPYVMPLHQAPTDGQDHSTFHFHIEFHPPLRKPNLLKYLAGPEIGGGNFLSDTVPEEKAAELRALPNARYA
ncbi:MAG: galactose-1-phosphate uridylyltransferase [Caldilineaceae bacterium]